MHADAHAGDVEQTPAEPSVAPRPLRAPDSPSDERRLLHELTHADFAPWCPHCIASKAPEDQHPSKQTRRSRNPRDPVGLPVFSRDGGLVEEESRAATVLTGVDTSSGWPPMVFIPHKGVDAYAVKSLMVRINRLGYQKVTLQHDPEEPLQL